jgi:hypothetical protein
MYNGEVREVLLEVCRRIRHRKHLLDLLVKMLEPNPDKRITIEEVYKSLARWVCILEVRSLPGGGSQVRCVHTFESLKPPRYEAPMIDKLCGLCVRACRPAGKWTRRRRSSSRSRRQTRTAPSSRRRALP